MNLPEGCYEKLNLFFKEKLKTRNKIFSENIKAKIRYLIPYEEATNYDDDLKQVDPILQDVLKKTF